jgi:cytidyltransferase-like protein
MALQKLRDHFNTTNRANFLKMLDQKVHVVEKLAASSFDVQRGDMTNLYYKSGQADPMNIVDRTIVRFYESAIRHLQGLSNEVKDEMPRDWRFGFDYLIDGETPNFKYSLLPKNNLVLTHIKVLNPTSGRVQKVIRDTQVLNKWAAKLEVQNPPVVFEGQLRHDQKEALINILEMSDAEFAKVYENKSFTKDVYSIFNSELRRSALQESLDAEIDALVVSFVDGKSMTSFKLESFDRVNEETSDRKPSDIYQITIVDVIEKLSSYKFKQHKLTEEKKDRRYIELMSEVFNNYIKENASKYIGVDFDTADFAKKDAFKLNKAFIKNQNTLKLVENNILAELFKIVLSSFRKERTKTTDILSEDMVNQMNEIVGSIQSHIDGKVDESDVLDFNSYIQKGKINNSPESEINEALKVKTIEHGRKPVNMFVGRFQPFTLGHAKVIKQLHDQNGYPTVIFLVKAKKAKKEDAFKRPYDEQTQLEMLNNLKKELPIEHVYIVPSAAIDVMFNELRPKYEPVLWGTGTDRMKQYGFQVDKPDYREDLNVRPDFGLYEIKRGDENISATKVRNAMLDDDFKAFKKMTPKGIHGMYNDLKNKLEQSMTLAESKETILTFEQFISNI